MEDNSFGSWDPHFYYPIVGSPFGTDFLFTGRILGPGFLTFQFTRLLRQELVLEIRDGSVVGDGVQDNDFAIDNFDVLLGEIRTLDDRVCKLGVVVPNCPCQ